MYSARAMNGNPAPTDYSVAPDEDSLPKSATTLWIEMALIIEEKQ
jgi:hypothetical protein